jgi:hypothetical protein
MKQHTEPSAPVELSLDPDQWVVKAVASDRAVVVRGMMVQIKGACNSSETYGLRGNVARHNVLLPDCRGPVTVTTGCRRG